ncbi:MAG: antitoxin VbhA family protein [Propionibacteriaceae bacterium]|nr:antitoxin VbhA family protein [Propionibacteriaceae bacterium]
MELLVVDSRAHTEHMAGHGPAVSPAERHRREREVALARASTELEGGATDDVARRIQDDYARGLIDADELVARTREQLGLPRDVGERG